MSIPKEPRQLMINLMYIVLTAILALNVSAEILNAFLAMDKSITDSNSVITLSNDYLMNAISKQAEAYQQFEPFKEKGLALRIIVSNFNDYIGSLKKEIIEQSGGLDDHQKPRGIKDKDITTRLMVNQGRGDQLEQEIRKVKNDILTLIEEENSRKRLEKNIPLEIAPIPENSDKTSWAQFTFQQMPVAAVLPLLTKLQNDVKVAETTILNFLFDKTNKDYKPDAFIPVVAANAGYVTLGKEYQAELFLSAYSSTADNVSIKVDGRSYPVINGKAVFSSRPKSIGEKIHEMIISFRNPLSNEVESYRKQFSYEVGERSVTASADKMNVFYVGVDNPLSISAAGIPSRMVKVNASNATIKKESNGKYIVKPAKTGTSIITVSGGDLQPVNLEYRVKRIPDPVILLGNKKGGTMSPAEFKAHQGPRPFLDNFDFDAKCKISSFEMARVPRGKSVQVARNEGGRYTAKTKRIIRSGQNRRFLLF